MNGDNFFEIFRNGVIVNMMGGDFLVGLMPRAPDNSLFGCNNYCSIRNNGANGVNGVNGDDGGKNAAEMHGKRMVEILMVS